MLYPQPDSYFVADLRLWGLSRFLIPPTYAREGGSSDAQTRRGAGERAAPHSRSLLRRRLSLDEVFALSAHVPRQMLSPHFSSPLFFCGTLLGPYVGCMAAGGSPLAPAPPGRTGSPDRAHIKSRQGSRAQPGSGISSSADLILPTPPPPKEAAPK